MIYDRTDGHCHICHKKIALVNYGSIGGRGAWEVEHSKPQAKGGTDHGNNLYPACISCNRTKSDYTTRTARKWSGTTTAPFSKAAKARVADGNADAGTVIGGLVGVVGGPIGIAIGAFIGRQVGRSIKVPKA